MMSLFVEKSPWIFVIFTTIIGGGAAWLAGRALAISWRPTWQIILYMTLLGLVLRFFQFALFQSTLLSLHYYITDTLILFAAASLGYRLTRVKQMVTQYAWEIERAGPLSWRKKTEAHKS